ncbi:5-(carboxyamino)imidazole ribonucleotide synthase [Aristophania vespae]|uniref:N5-carboxyaminoimidazole ribonucleotide synthase n=1 Tax=Aristophania vespae TaxID=2697033 RepID=A0A6P1NKY2_9PROT|nr:5-(carboxyamino)imidazole ribonucleotide synthase [Aristophania vespae]QHI95531.1 5-(carboxyamino)imidazole ribonucleotide synthase [Aristophania vespae]
MKTLKTGSTIGIVGGGQLGRMGAMAAAKLGFRVHIFTDTMPSPAGEVAAACTVGSYDDATLLEAFARDCDVITFEFENISAAGLRKLEENCVVYPASSILEISQDRISEKRTLTELELPVAPWIALHSAADLAALKEFGFPCIVKTARLGYDGKGQYRLNKESDFEALLSKADTLSYPLVAEKFVDFQREISVMVVRQNSENYRVFDPSENRHKDGILRISLAPAPISPDLAQQAQNLAIKLAEKLNLVGIMGVEMFHDHKGQLIINEIAPRPHNSGHWTMDACAVDQFEMHIRAVAGLPLPSSRRHSDAVMHNLIGPEDMSLLPFLLKEDDGCLHLYGKKEVKPGRKMGHINRLFPKGGLPGELVLSEFLPNL